MITLKTLTGIKGCQHDTDGDKNCAHHPKGCPVRFAITTEFIEGDAVQTALDHTVIVDEVKTAKTFYGTDGSKYNSKMFFKILAPISPQVTWEIQDGAEIEVKELCELVKNEKFKSFHGYLPQYKRKGIGVYKVKGPCGHYH